jgi:WD40 repeat protein
VTIDGNVTPVDTATGAAGDAHRLGRTGPVGMTFSTNGRRIVAATAVADAMVVDLTEDPPNPRPVGYETQITAVAFSPDGRLAVSGGVAGPLVFRDPETFAPIGAPLSSNDTQLFQLTFSPDGRLVAASDIGGQTRLVDVEARRPLGTALPSALGDYESFSPDGKKMATSWSATTLVWDLDPALWHEPACEIAGRNLTAAQRREYLPHDPDAAPTCERFAG